MRLTEQPSKYDNLEKMSVKELITNINNALNVLIWGVQLSIS